jgi:hypothetical protein
MGSELSGGLLRTVPAQRLQRSRLDAADSSHRDVKRPRRLGERPWLAVGKAQSKLQDATVKIAQPEEQFPHRERLSENSVQLVPGLQALQGGAIHKFQRPRPLV